LEIGTGTGWNAALLAHRLGDANVTTVEVDPGVADTARAALDRAGLHPTVVTGDGSAGHPPRAPYDRIDATCGVQDVPREWITQTKPGGQILAPWGTRFGNGEALVRLSVAQDGTASGRFVRLVEFMRLRSQRAPRGLSDVHIPDGSLDNTDRSVTTVRGEDFVTGSYTTVPFMLGLRVKNCVQAVAPKRKDSRPVWFYGIGDTSWAVVVFRDGREQARVWQEGPRRLWDEVEAAFRWWEEQGRPEAERFGLTVDRDGQRAWLDAPDAPWEL
jgi:hypothetical protein